MTTLKEKAVKQKQHEYRQNKSQGPTTDRIFSQYQESIMFTKTKFSRISRENCNFYNKKKFVFFFHSVVVKIDFFLLRPMCE